MHIDSLNFVDIDSTSEFCDESPCGHRHQEVVPLDIHDTQDAIAVKRALIRVFLLVGHLRLHLAHVALINDEAGFLRGHLHVTTTCFIGKREERFLELGLGGIVSLLALSMYHALAAHMNLLKILSLTPSSAMSVQQLTLKHCGCSYTLNTGSSSCVLPPLNSWFCAET